jgi:hypothetical protein
VVAANRADIAFAIQTAKGAPASVSKYRTFLMAGRQPGQMRTHAPFDQTTANRIITDMYASEAHVDGSPQTYVMPKSIAAWLTLLLGGRVTTGAGDPYLHTITPASTLLYATFWRWLADLVFEKNADCKVTKAVIHFESGKPITITCTILGLSPQYKTAHETTVTVEQSQYFMHYDGAAALLVEGAAVSSIRSGDLTIDNGGQLVPGDAFTPYDVAETTLTITLATTQLVLDMAMWKRLHYGSATPSDAATPLTTPLELAGSPAGVDFKWTRVAAAPGPERSIEILLPRVQPQPFDIEPLTQPNPLIQTITYDVLAPADGTTPAITALVKNSVADAAF